MAQEMSWEDLAAVDTGKFEVHPHYDSDSDTLSIFIAEDESFRERIDARLTVYRSLATKQVVGCHIKHVKAILDTVQEFNLDVSSGGVTIGILLMGLPLTDGCEPRVLNANYRQMVRPITERAGRVRVKDFEFAST